MQLYFKATNVATFLKVEKIPEFLIVGSRKKLLTSRNKIDWFRAGCLCQQQNLPASFPFFKSLKNLDRCQFLDFPIKISSMSCQRNDDEKQLLLSLKKRGIPDFQAELSLV